MGFCKYEYQIYSIFLYSRETGPEAVSEKIRRRAGVRGTQKGRGRDQEKRNCIGGQGVKGSRKKLIFST